MDSLILLTEVAMVGVPIWAFVRLRRRVAAGELARWRGVGYYTLWLLLPLLLYLFVFGLLVAAEAVFGIAVVSEGMGRTLLPLVIAGLVIWSMAIGLFIASLFFIQPR